ncbi:minor tail protein [Microbacterium phage Quenya]|uniref:minor tail protein n=1 Tax=Microbacterium phage Quenya TaxID=2776868 RepID=UPI0018A33D08|nr:minor tail protein [Microbacterium phage Quenya]QOP64255.1 minor tail protein [Microbacterium phage Quenya]
MVSSNFPNRPFRLEEWVTIYGQNAWNNGNNALIHSELWIRKNSYSPSWSASGSSYQMFINSTLVGQNGNFGYDFRNSDQLLLHASDNWFGADAGGHMYVQIDGYANVVTLGYTEVHSGFWAPRIPRPPSPPNVYAVENITTTSMGFRYNRGDNNGAGIDYDHAQWATDSGFTQVVWDDNGDDGSGPSGYTSPGGGLYGPVLVPGKTYYVRVRSHNSAGWGGWSNTGSAKTLAAVYVSDGAAWKSAEIYVSNGTQWRPVEVYYSKSGAWTVPASL